MSEASSTYTPGTRSRVKLKRERGSYDHKAVYSILDAALLCNVGYIIDGQPYVTPTAFWRDGNHLYWHGSSASRALKGQTGLPVCLTVSHVDGLVIARSGFHSSINYRSVMAFGTAFVVTDEAEKAKAMDVFVDRFVPERSRSNRPPTADELRQTKLLGMEIEEASAKIRTGPPGDDEEDYALPIWAGVVAFKTIVEAIEPDPRNLNGLAVPNGISVYGVGEELGSVLSRIY